MPVLVPRIWERAVSCAISVLFVDAAVFVQQRGCILGFNMRVNVVGLGGIGRVGLGSGLSGWQLCVCHSSSPPVSACPRNRVDRPGRHDTA